MSRRGRRGFAGCCRPILAPAGAYPDQLRQPLEGDRQDALRTLVGQRAVVVADFDDDLALAGLVPAFAETNEVIGAAHGGMLAPVCLHGVQAGLPQRARVVVELGRDDDRDRRDVVAVPVVDLRVLAHVAACTGVVRDIGHRRVVAAEDVAEGTLEERRQVTTRHELARRCRHEQLLVGVGEGAVALGLLGRCRGRLRLSGLRGRRLRRSVHAAVVLVGSAGSRSQADRDQESCDASCATVSHESRSVVVLSRTSTSSV